SLDGYGTIDANPERIALGIDAIGWAQRGGASILLFPSGYLRSSSERGITRTACRLTDAAQDIRMGIVVGVDIARKDNRDDFNLVRRGELPYFAIACFGGRCFAPWRQRSTTSKNGDEIPDHLADEVREISVRDHKLGVLLCGEVFSKVL